MIVNTLEKFINLGGNNYTDKRVDQVFKQPVKTPFNEGYYPEDFMSDPPE